MEEESMLYISINQLKKFLRDDLQYKRFNYYNIDSWKTFVEMNFLKD